MMLKLFMVIALVTSEWTGAATAKQQQACKKPAVRRAWHKLNRGQKKAYIEAELCLINSPTKTHLPAAISRFDDLVKAHQLQSPVIHNDGWFLPFHRWYMHTHEKLLKDECGYNGIHPYWDEAMDAGAFSRSVIFDSDTGFGGNGSGSDRCVTDGPFANMEVHVGPGYENRNRCLSRNINDYVSVASAQAFIDACIALPTYGQAWPCFEQGINSTLNPGFGLPTIILSPHRGGHGGVGGDMINPVSSPADPLFYMHHAFIDRIWWQWQMIDPAKRLTEISGYTTQTMPPGGWVNATLDDELNMFGIIPNITVSEVMDTKGGYLCYVYD